MKKLFGLLTLALCTVGLFTSCSKEDSNKVKLTIESELGDLGNYISVTDKEVTVTLSDEKETKDGKEVELKVLAGSIAVNIKKAVASDYSIGFDAEVLDENHNKIADLPDFNIDGKYDYDNGDLNNCYAAGNTRAQMKHGGEASEWKDEDQKMWDDICNKGKYIVLKPSYENAKYAEYKAGETVDESSSDESEPDVASGDFDEWLDSYEEFCNDYIDLIKKASQGDMDALSEYPEMLKKAQELGEKMQNAQSDATPEQWSRFLEIQKKLMKAANNMN